ncbi:MAG TPA: amino acid ABC transporter substrate-binding protein [Stellaceae bacterium]|nr:amino acid ABC transporter substrate-binding protein [Stellaceae bacterium]
MIIKQLYIAFLAWILLAAPALAQGRSTTLDAVLARGQLSCGVGGDIAGFSLADGQGAMRGLDADGCRAIAAAVLGDAKKVRFVPLTAVTRFTAIQSGEVDVLLRNTSWTLARESNLGLLFAATNFWDSTGFMVKAASGIKSASDLNGASICVRSGTSTEIDVADWTRSHGVKATVVLIGDVNAIQQAFLSGRCDAYATDSSQLAGFRFTQGANGNTLLILPETVSPAQSGSMVRKGDDAWFDIVRWVHFAQVAAEAEGVTSVSVESQLTSTSPDIKRLLGVEGDLGKSLGLDNRWAYNVIAQVGNYGEMYDRDILPLGLARGPNALVTKGGLQFSPLMR